MAGKFLAKLCLIVSALLLPFLRYPRKPRAKLCLVVADVTNDTRDAGAGDVFHYAGLVGRWMANLEFLGARTSVRQDVLYDLDARDWPRHTFPARIIRALNLFERIEIAASSSLPLWCLPSFLAEAHRRLQDFRLRRLTSSLRKLQADFAANFYEEAATEVGKAVELLNMSPAQRRQYRMLPRYFCKHLGQAFLAWSRAHPAVALPRMAVALQ